MTTHLRERDYDLLHAIGLARFLSAWSLDWLFCAEHADPKDARRARYPDEWVYRRMRQLDQAGYARALDVQGERVYALTSRGAVLLQDRWNIDQADVTVTDSEPGADKLAHAIAVGRFYAALRAALADRLPRIHLRAWQIDARLEARDGIKPDATFRLTDSRNSPALRFALEVDRGGRNLDTWKPKAETYAAWLRADPNLTLLIVAPTRRRMVNIADEVFKLTGPTEQVRYAEAKDISPEEIAGAWYWVNAEYELTACPLAPWLA